MNDTILQKEKQKLRQLSIENLDTFFTQVEQFEFQPSLKPKVSIILILWNQAELTLQCLKSLKNSKFKDFEIIIIDNASSDRTSLLLKSIHGITTILNEYNIGFLKAVNQGANVARGEFLLLLNNDAVIDENALDEAIKVITSDSKIGAVGGKIILPGGLLQEAGSIIWQDGTCSGYLRGYDTNHYEALFERDVDFCSGVFLLTRTDIFKSMGGLDVIYAPAYYEETDYCVRLIKNDFRIVYSPKVIVHHYEFGSATKSDWAFQQMSKNHKIFLDRHQDFLRGKFLSQSSSLLMARMNDKKPRILFFDDTAPRHSMGAGYPRAISLLKSLENKGYFITLFPLQNYMLDYTEAYKDIPDTIEIVLDKGPSYIREFLFSRNDYYDVIIVSRPINMNIVKDYLIEFNLIGSVKLIYDAEALWSLRDIIYTENILGRKLTNERKNQLIQQEINLSTIANSIITVNEYESSQFAKLGYQNVFTIGHALEIKPTMNGFKDRDNILFVGNLEQRISPNFDSIAWFLKDIFPILVKVNKNIKFVCVGSIIEQLKEELYSIAANYQAKNNIEILGRVDDITEFYNSAKVFIAPTRFAAGIPFKCHEAASFGVPMVTTELIANQLKWHDRVNLMTADSAEEFANKVLELFRNDILWKSLRDNALSYITSYHNMTTFDTEISNCIAFTSPNSLCNAKNLVTYLKEYSFCRKTPFQIQYSFADRVFLKLKRIKFYIKKIIYKLLHKLKIC